MTRMAEQHVQRLADRPLAGLRSAEWQEEEPLGESRTLCLPAEHRRRPPERSRRLSAARVQNELGGSRAGH